MQEEILELYEKIKDQLSEEEFEAEMDAVRQSNDEIPFFDDLDCARMVLQNYGIENTMDKKEESSEELPFDVSSDEGTSVEPSVETGFTMTEEILEQYNKVSDKISEEDFLKRMEYYKNKNQDNKQNQNKNNNNNKKEQNMSRQNTDQMLRAVEMKERQTQEKLKRNPQSPARRYIEKNW